MDLEQRISNFLKIVDRSKNSGIIYSDKIDFNFLKKHIEENISNKKIYILNINKDTSDEEIDRAFRESIKEGNLLFLQLEKFVPKKLANYLYQLYTNTGILEEDLQKITPHENFILLAQAGIKNSKSFSENIDKYFNYRLTV